MSNSKIISFAIALMMIFGGLPLSAQDSGEVIHDVGEPISSGTGGLADSPWPMFRQNLRHTGLSPYDTSGNPGKLKWSFTTGGRVSSSPAIDSDGTIYVGSYDDKLYAINPDGSEKWNFTTGGNVHSSPAIGSDGTIYFGSKDNKLYAINPNGDQKWSFTTGDWVRSSPAISSDGTIYFGSFDNNLYAINHDGTEKWNFTTGNLVYSSPTVGSDGTIYIGTIDGNLYAINLNGKGKWSYKTGGPIHSSPAIGSDGTIYVGSCDHKLYAIKPDGSEKWSFTTGNHVHSSPAIGYDNTIYIGSYNNKLYAIKSDGTLKWIFTTGVAVGSSPAIGSDGTIYVGSHDNKLYAINPDGTERWNFTTGGEVYSSPTVGSDGTIYVGSCDHKLYAIGTPPSLNINVTSHFSELNSAAQSSITVHVTDGTNPVQGATVNLGSDNGGIFSPQSGITDANGDFKSIFNAPTVTSQIICRISAEASKSGYNDATGYVDVIINPIPWPMFRGNLNNTGQSSTDTSWNKGNLKWRFKTGTQILASPVVGRDGIIYCGSDDDYLYALNSDGTEKWKFKADFDVHTAPAIGSDGMVYVTSEDHKLYALNPDGTKKWSFPASISIQTSPIIGADGTIYFGSHDYNLYAINPDGTEKWYFTTGNQIQSSPAIDTKGIIYIGSHDKKLYAINPDGTEKWSFTTGGVVHSSPAVGSDGTIYIGSTDNRVYAIYPDGTLKWVFITGSHVVSSPAVTPDGTVYIGSSDHKLYAINADGTEKWNFMTGNKVDTSPAIGSDGTIYVGSWDGKLYSINPDGTEKWNYSTGLPIWRSSPAIDSNGTIYIGSTDHYLYAIGSPTQNQPPIANSGPDQTIYEGSPVQFDASASYDPDGIIESYEWDFGDGSPMVTGVAPTYVYSSSANYTVILTVTDNDGASDTDTCTIFVLPALQPPFADAGPDQTVNEGDVVQFNGSGSYDPKGYGKGTWDIQVVDSQDDVGKWASLDVDADGNPQISYWDYSNKDLKYTRWTGTDWNIETIDSIGYVGHYNSMALDTNGYPHIAYVDFTNDFLKYAKWTGTEWLIENIDSNGWYNSLTLDSQDHPHISYYGGPSRGLMYAKWTGSAWEIEKVGDQITSAIYTAIALDSMDRPHISYDNNNVGNSKFEYARWTGSTWEIEILDYADNFGDFNSITIDTNDHPHVSYSDRTKGHLKYARWDGNTWKIEIVDDIGIFKNSFVLRASSITLDNDDIPHITFYDSKNGTLKYAIRTSSNWNIEIVDSDGDIGCHNSLVLQDGEIPHIAYYDNTNGNLKYATGFRKASSPLFYYWDFNNYIDSNGDGNFTNDVDAIGPTATHTYGDDGVYIVTLRVTDNDNLSATDTCNVTVQNVDPTVIIESITMNVEIGLRIAGRKYNNVSMTLYEDGSPLGYVSIERMPGSPDEQMAWIPVSINFSKSYNATVTYTPEDPPNVGGNPVWIYIKSQNGSINKIHHTFNVQQSKKRNSEHWNHVEPWEVDMSHHFIGLPFEITSHIMDPGSDDETLTYTYGTQVKTVTYLDSPPNPDPYPSPEVNPKDIMDTVTLVYEGPGTITLFVKDDDNIRFGIGQGTDSIDVA